MKFVLVSWVMVIQGCAYIQENIQPESPTVSINKVKLINTSRFQVDVTVFNPNSYDLTGNNLEYSFHADDQTLGRGSYPDEISIASEGTEVISVPIELDSKAITRALAKWFFDPNSARVQWKVQMNSKFLFWSIPVENQGEIAIKP